MGSQADVAAVIVGCGFAGVGMSIELRRAGIDDFVVLERAESLGGTWRDNVYPGCACDVPSHLYCFSYAPHVWSRSFAPQQEIRAYLEGVVDRFDLRRHIRYGAEVQSAEWDPERARWQVRTRAGDVFRARALILGTGPFNVPVLPDIPELDRFAGAQFHSARWNTEYDFRGKRVAVVGTGASGVQIVPELQREARQLYLIQRTPPWVLPRRGRTFSPFERTLLKLVPGLRSLYRFLLYWRYDLRALALNRYHGLLRLLQVVARKHLERAISSEELRQRLTPSYTIGCKRMLLSDDYYPALASPNVEVVSERVARGTERGLALDSGRELELDAIVYATGFAVQDPFQQLEVRAGGQNLGDVWRQNGAQAYLGTTVAGFPNLFLLLGPNTGLGHTSILIMIEGQARYIAQAVELLSQDGVRSIELRRDVQTAFSAWLKDRHASTVWSSGCSSWYLSSAGENTVIWPGLATAFRRRTARLRREDYEIA